MRDFDSEQIQRHAGVDPDSLQFKLGGHALTRLVSFSPYVLTEFQGLESPGMEETIVYLRKMLDPSCHAAFDLALREGNPRPTMDTLMELVSWLVEQATARPTSRASSSSAGLATTGTPSTDGSQPQPVLTSAN